MDGWMDRSERIQRYYHRERQETRSTAKWNPPRAIGSNSISQRDVMHPSPDACLPRSPSRDVMIRYRVSRRKNRQKPVRSRETVFKTQCGKQYNRYVQCLRSPWKHELSTWRSCATDERREKLRSKTKRLFVFASFVVTSLWNLSANG